MSSYYLALFLIAAWMFSAGQMDELFIGAIIMVAAGDIRRGL